MSTPKTDSQSQRSSKRALSPAEVAAVTDAEIDFSDIPELDETFWREAKLVMPDRTEQSRKPRAAKARTYSRMESIGLWSGSCSERLAAARSLSREDIKSLQEDLCRGCPVDTWPYGNATSINPMVVVLGPSPGGSGGASAGNPDEPLSLPEAGKPHPHVVKMVEKPDKRLHWKKTQILASTLMPSLAKEDVQTLFGQLNLDTRPQGDADKVRIQSDFADWVLVAIRDKLRPRVVICTGLKGRLKERELRSQFQQHFPGFELSEPHRETPFHDQTKLAFSEWDIEAPFGNSLKLVLWPQAPSFPPFAWDLECWKRSCLQFRTLIGDWIRA